jgi:hypothetical protein
MVNGKSIESTGLYRLLAKLIAPAVLLLLIYAVYLAYSLIFIPDGRLDPVYRLSGIARTSQLIYVVAFFLLYCAIAILVVTRRMPWQNIRDHRAGLLALSGLIFLNFLAASFPAILRELHLAHLMSLLVYLAVVLLLQGIVVHVLLSRLRNQAVSVTALAVLATINAYSLHIVLREAFHQQPDALQALLLTGIFLGLLVVLVLCVKGLLPVRGANTVLAVMLIAAPAAVLVNAGEGDRSDDSVAPFETIVFGQSPDVYVIGFESMMPTSLARRYLELDELAHDRVLEEIGADMLANAFVSDVPTRLALNSIMALAQPGIKGRYDYFAGRSDSPLAAVFRANGYWLTTGYANLYFGQKGDFVNEYHPEGATAIANNSLCALAVDTIWKLFAYCDVIGGTVERQQPWPEDVKAIASGRRMLDRPAFTFVHMSPLNHTTLDYRSDDRAAFERFREQYRGESEDAAQIIRELARIVSEDGRNSFMLVLGDHGPWLSRTIFMHDDPEFFVHDRYGIRMAVLVNQTACDSQALGYYSDRYTTPERVVTALLRCLAEHPEKVDDALAGFEENHPFEQFLYE